MNHKLKSIGSAMALGVASLALVSQAHAAAIIYNTGSEATATVALGINNLGNLNTSDPLGAFSVSNSSRTGVAAKFPDGSFRDATSPGCFCEGWGMSATDTSTSIAHGGGANVSSGTSNVTGVSFVTDAAAVAGVGSGTFATSVVTLTSLPGLQITQHYTVADKTSRLMMDTVTLKNVGTSILDNVRYVRVMDWDIPPTEFSEFVTIRGTATTTLLELSHDDGFENPNPLLPTGAILPGTTDVDFVDAGPADHGAYFKFNFGSLLAGTERTFRIFYGAGDSEADALDAIADQGIELFSFGQQRGDPTGGTPKTYIFGFAGVGGRPIFPTDTVPTPATLGLLGAGLMGLAALRRRQAA